MADQRITDDEAAILRSWLSGNGIHAIAKARRTTDAYIAACIDGLCNYDRQRGRDILESGLRPDAAPPAAAPKRVPPTADLPVEPVPAAEPAAAAEPAPPVDDPPLAPAPEPEVTVRRRATTPARYLVDDLLVRADRSGLQRVATLTARIRAAAEELATMLDRADAETAARALVALRRRELEEAEAQLREMTGKPARRAHPSTDATVPASSVVRAWARANGVDCNPHGQVPAHLVEAYLKAQVT